MGNVAQPPDTETFTGLSHTGAELRIRAMEILSDRLLELTDRAQRRQPTPLERRERLELVAALDDLKALHP
jgi:hypothetical protein